MISRLAHSSSAIARLPLRVPLVRVAYRTYTSGEA
jgi:hypothetical protein